MRWLRSKSDWHEFMIEHYGLSFRFIPENGNESEGFIDNTEELITVVYNWKRSLITDGKGVLEIDGVDHDIEYKINLEDFIVD